MPISTAQRVVSPRQSERPYRAGAVSLLLLVLSFVCAGCAEYKESTVYKEQSPHLQLLGDEYDRLEVSEPLMWVYAEDGWSPDSGEDKFEIGDITFSAETYYPHNRPDRFDYSKQFRDRLISTATQRGWHVVESQGTIKVSANIWYSETRVPSDLSRSWRESTENHIVGVELKLTDRDGNTLFACVHRKGGFGVIGAWDNWMKDFFDQLRDL